MRDAAPELHVLVGRAEEVDDLRELRLRLVDPGDVIEGDGDLLGIDAPRLRAAEVAEEPRAAGPARRPRNTNRPTSKIVGPKPSSTSPISEVPVVGDCALTWTPFDCTSFVRLTLSQNVGTSVENSVVSFADLSSAGYRTLCSNVPWIESPFEVIDFTSPRSTCDRKYGLNGTVTLAPRGLHDQHQEEVHDEQHRGHDRERPAGGGAVAAAARACHDRQAWAPRPTRPGRGWVAAAPGGKPSERPSAGLMAPRMLQGRLLIVKRRRKSSAPPVAERREAR